MPGTLTLGSDGALYGTTCTGANYHGTIFKMTTGGVFASLANIPSSFGSFPNGIVEGPDGNFYGTTYNGLTQSGKFYRVTPGGTITALADLSGNWMWYGSNLTLAPDGNFYGTTLSGGSADRGTVFKATTSGVITTLLNFDGFNGFWPCGGLTVGPDGYLYGTTMYGVINHPVSGVPVNQDGTVFCITTAGSFVTLARFASLSNGETRLDGARPYGGVVFDTDGNLYGTTFCGGKNSTGAEVDGGVIFRLTAEAIAVGTASLSGSFASVSSSGATQSTSSLHLTITDQPVSQNIDTGKPVTFTVSAMGSSRFSSLKYQWRKNGKAIANGGTFSGAKTAALTLKNVRKVDAGSYSVVVTDAKKSKAVSSAAALTVNVVDSDQDGISDDADRYPGTVAGDKVNKLGGSITQLVPTTGPLAGGTWKSHAQYVNAVAKSANAFRLARLITAQQSAAIIRAASLSTVGI